MIVLIKCLNEETGIARCIKDFYDEPFCERIIVIDGGSTDYTVQELRQFDKVEVYVHPWQDWYHDMEIMQSNIALSYVPNGELCCIIDCDERFNDPLKIALNEITAVGNRLPNGADVVHIARRTHELMRHLDSPFCMYEEDGWPVISNQIGQFPDYQCRLIHRSPKLHWINSPHHVLCGQTNEVQLASEAHIIHYEKDDSRKRIQIEKKWLRAQARRKMLGLSHDVFECKPKAEICQFSDPDSWTW